MLASRSLFQPYGRVLLRGWCNNIATVAAPLPLARFLKCTILLGAGDSAGCHAAEPALGRLRRLDHL